MPPTKICRRDPEAIPGLDLARLSAPARVALDRIGRIDRVSIPVLEVAAWLPDCHSSGVEAALDELAAAELIWRSDSGKSTPTARGYAGPIVTLSWWVAAAYGLKLNARSTRWIPRGVKERSDRLKARDDDRQSPGFSHFVSEADLTPDDPFFAVDQAADPKARDPLEIVAESDEAIRRGERLGGYIRPQRLLGASLSWPADGPGFTQDRWPYVDSPAMKRPPIGDRACTACADRADHGEYCLICRAYFADAKIPPTIRKEVARSIKLDRRNIDRDSVPVYVEPPPSKLKRKTDVKHRPKIRDKPGGPGSTRKNGRAS